MYIVSVSLSSIVELLDSSADLVIEQLTISNCSLSLPDLQNSFCHQSCTVIVARTTKIADHQNYQGTKVARTTEVVQNTEVARTTEVALVEATLFTTMLLKPVLRPMQLVLAA